MMSTTTNNEQLDKLKDYIRVAKLRAIGDNDVCQIVWHEDHERWGLSSAYFGNCNPTGSVLAVHPDGSIFAITRFGKDCLDKIGGEKEIYNSSL